jgi:hypothetical protein
MSDGARAANSDDDLSVPSDFPTANPPGPLVQERDDQRVVESGHRVDFSSGSQAAGRSSSPSLDDGRDYVTEWDPRLS